MAAARNICKALPRCRRVLLAGTQGSRALSSRGGGGGRRDSQDFDLESLLADMPPSSSSSSFSSSKYRGQKGKAASSEDGKASPSNVWESLLKEPTKETQTPAAWRDVMEDLNKVHTKRPQPRSSPPLSTPSFRNLADSGFEFLLEGVERPAPSQREPASEQQDSGEGSILHAASFKLLRDSFQFSPTKPASSADKKTLDDKLGLDSKSLFSSTGTWSKGGDSQSLSEVEGSFYSIMDHSSLLDIKTYTYEELGERLRKVRPLKEQVLSSATGLSFGELRARFEKIEEEEREEGEHKESINDYRDLREGLNHLRPLSKRELTFDELTFVNDSGMNVSPRVRIEYNPPNDELLTKYYSEIQLSSKDRLKLQIKKLKEEFQIHEYDSGSPQVQIALLTARINNLNRHMREGPNYKRDKHSKKGLNDMVQQRKRMLRYLRRRDWPAYCNVLTKLKLDDVILEKRR